MLQRLLAYGWGGGLVLLSAWPAVREPRVDSYPLSTYPMFSQRRGQPIIERMQVLQRERSPTPVPPRLIANSETLQAAVTIRRAVSEGKRAMRILCREVAKRVAGEAELSQAVWIEIRRDRYDPIGYFELGRQALESKRLYRCRVPR
jgi:hypothetical protein